MSTPYINISEGKLWCENDCTLTIHISWDKSITPHGINKQYSVEAGAKSHKRMRGKHSLHGDA